MLYLGVVIVTALLMMGVTSVADLVLRSQHFASQVR